MLSKEEILAYVQQGQAQPGWQVLRPKASYLARQAIAAAILAVIFIGLGALFIGQNSFVITPITTGSLDPNTFQTWRFIDVAILALVIVLFAGISIKFLLDLNTVPDQVLVLMPDGFLLKKRNTEQFVLYAGVAGISGRTSRYGYVTLNVKPVGSTTIYKVQLDGRYGNARALASQIIGAQRQYVARQRSGAARPQ